jgi:hypothetical protein
VVKKSADKQLAVTNDGGWLSVKQAARLCRTSSAALKAMIKTGELRAFTIERGGKVRFRLTRADLVSAGLLGGGPAPEPLTATVDLLSLIRDQNQRISALEDQRAALAGQLGMALERLRTIDERLASLEALPSASDPNEPAHADRVAQRSSDVLLRSIFKALPIPGISRGKQAAS